MIKVGTGTYGSPRIMGDKNDVYIGKYCSIAENVTFDCGLNHNYNNISTYPFNSMFNENPHKNNSSYPQNHPITRGDIIVGNDVWIGKDVTIMSGVTIGDGSIIGTKSLVTSNVEPYSIVGGIPAKEIRKRFSEKEIKILNEIKWWNWTHSEIESSIDILMSGNIEALHNKHKEKAKKFCKGNRIGIVTRSMNNTLYAKMRELFPSNFDFIQVTDCHGTEGAINYIYKIIFMQEYDWIINIDEDFFSFDSGKNIISLLEHMIDNEIDYCGISDGGMCIHRFHSPIVTNPFFNIFNSKKIREALDDINYVQTHFHFNESMLQYMPKNIKDGFPWVNDNFEPFYQFFYWLPCRGFKPLYLESYESDDKISTIVKNHKGKEMGIHTWFTREYGINSENTKRIDNAFNFAKSKK